MCCRTGLVVSLIVFAWTSGASAQQATRWKAHRVPDVAIEHLNALNGAGIAEFVYNSAGGFVIVTHDRRCVERKVPPPVAESIEKMVGNQEQIRTIAFTPDSKGWCVVSDQNLSWGGELPPNFVDKLQEFHNNGESILTVAFGPRGSWIIVSDREWSESGMPQKVVEDLQEFIKLGAPSVIAFTPTGGYALTAGTRYLVRGIPDECLAEIERNAVDGFVNDSIVFATDDSWAVVAHKDQ